uniref:PBPe domain-containing protein n=3 Tax=Bursaphelenchus xylophilus TaxID=6326 RepID=A0A1I7SKS4_BURXY
MAYVYSIWDAYWITLSFLETPNASEQYGHLLMDPMWFEDGKQMTFVASSFDSTPLRMFIFSATTVITLVYISVFMFSKHVFRELGQRKHLMSKKTIEMQQGMNRMLIAQSESRSGCVVFPQNEYAPSHSNIINWVMEVGTIKTYPLYRKVCPDVKDYLDLRSAELEEELHL